MRSIRSWAPCLPLFGVLTPYPGTPLYGRLEKEGRLTRPRHWLDFQSFKATYVPKHMTPEDVEDEVRRAWLGNYEPAAFRAAQRWLLDRGAAVLAAIDAFHRAPVLPRNLLSADQPARMDKPSCPECSDYGESGCGRPAQPMDNEARCDAARATRFSLQPGVSLSITFAGTLTWRQASASSSPRPLTEMIDHAGYFIQMGMASMPLWMEKAMNRKYPEWKNVSVSPMARRLKAPAGLRVLEQVLVREFGREHVIVCYPDDLDQFIGDDTRAVGYLHDESAGNDLRSRGLYLDFRELSRTDQRALRAPDVRDALRRHPVGRTFKVIVGGAGGWQITQTRSAGASRRGLCRRRPQRIVETLALFRKAVEGRPIPPLLSGDPSAGRGESAVSRASDDFWCCGDDHRMRPALQLLRARSEPADRDSEGQDHARQSTRTWPTGIPRCRCRARTCSSGVR